MGQFLIRGAVVWIDLMDAIPPESGKRRPGVVVSNSAQNALLNSVVVVPLSTRHPEIAYLRVRIAPIGTLEGFAVIPGIRQIKKSRILERVGQLTRQDLRRLDEAILVYLGE